MHYFYTLLGIMLDVAINTTSDDPMEFDVNEDGNIVCYVYSKNVIDKCVTSILDEDEVYDAINDGESEYKDVVDAYIVINSDDKCIDEIVLNYNKRFNVRNQILEFVKDYNTYFYYREVCRMIVESNS